MVLRPALLAAALLLGGGVPAWSHAILMESVPPIGGRAAAGMLAITLRYNSLIDARRSRLVLIGPDGRERRLAVTPGRAGDRMTAAATVTPGANLLRWQVLAVDGHITRGNVKFDVTEGAAAAPGR